MLPIKSPEIYRSEADPVEVLDWLLHKTESPTWNLTLEDLSFVKSAEEQMILKSNEEQRKSKQRKSKKTPYQILLNRCKISMQHDYFTTMRRIADYGVREEATTNDPDKQNFLASTEMKQTLFRIRMQFEDIGLLDNMFPDGQ